MSNNLDVNVSMIVDFKNYIPGSFGPQWSQQLKVTLRPNLDSLTSCRRQDNFLRRNFRCLKGNLERATIPPSLLIVCITWFSNCSSRDHILLQKVRWLHIIKAPLSCPSDIYATDGASGAKQITAHTQHSHNKLLWQTPLQHGQDWKGLFFPHWKY